VQLGRIQDAKFACQKGLQLDPSDQQMKQLLQQVNQMEMVQKAKDYEEAERKKKEEEAAAIVRQQQEEEQAAKDAIVSAGTRRMDWCSFVLSYFFECFAFLVNPTMLTPRAPKAVCEGDQGDPAGAQGGHV
jgi:hypothetical protein